MAQTRTRIGTGQKSRRENASGKENYVPGPTRRSEIFGGRRVGIAELHPPRGTFPLACTDWVGVHYFKRGTTQASCTRAPIGADTSGGWRSRRPPRRRRQNSYRLNSSDAARSRRAHSGGPTRRSEIFSGRTVGFSSSTHRSHQKPLHVLIGSPLTIYEGGVVACTGGGGATGIQNARMVYPHGRRRQQFSPALV